MYFFNKSFECIVSTSITRWDNSDTSSGFTGGYVAATQVS